MASLAEHGMHTMWRKLKIHHFREELEECALPRGSCQAAEVIDRICEAIREAQALSDCGLERLCARAAAVHSEVNQIAFIENGGGIRSGNRRSYAYGGRLPLAGVGRIIAIRCSHPLHGIQGIEFLPITVTVDNDDVQAANAHQVQVSDSLAASGAAWRQLSTNRLGTLFAVRPRPKQIHRQDSWNIHARCPLDHVVGPPSLSRVHAQQALHSLNDIGMDSMDRSSNPSPAPCPLNNSSSLHI
mmetsp:Transcript_107530/g.269756  ORF Transcript_107530/g.269756 Transcript_107530/m.269756 type:complete len:243 (-) Transcript_107530:653-1381(-)